MTASPADQALGAYLATLRTSAGLDVHMLARRVSLSVAQLSELESGGASLFYNRNIRLQAARKIIAHLGGDLTKVLADTPAPAEPTADTFGAAAAASANRIPAHMNRPTTGSGASQMLAAAGSSRAWGRPAAVFSVTAVVVLVAGVVTTGRWIHSTPQTMQVVELPDAARTSSPAPSEPAPRQPLKSAPDDAAPMGIAAATPPVQAGPAPRSANNSLSSNAAPPCALSSGQAPVFQPVQARKPGDMVYVVSQVSQVLCVVDASGKSRVQRFEAGQSQSFYGQPPWQVVSSQLQQTQMYFQGARVRLPAQAQDRIELVELR